ncbi:uncharacterized protein LOC106013369, partial [Aplysia californica]|uniref:Uncharacterized protein LOC106013369 n=1 Tax=Aplysia californica TaxID=6500 RepID=A0ABM1AB61_APLCA
QLSILKIDVEEWEWPSLPEALTSGALDDVSQLLVEFHLTIKPQPRQARYLHSLLLLRHLYLAGFRTFYTSRNLHCAFRQIFDGAHKAGCHEVNMIRVKSVKFADLDIFEDR